MKHTGVHSLLKIGLPISLMLIVSISGILAMTSVKAAPAIDYTAIEEEIDETEHPFDDSMWYTPRYEMLIIVTDDFVSTLQPLADWKNEKGVATKIVNATEYMSFSGRDTAERIRNCIRSYYLSHPLKWVLLGADTNLIPTRYVYNPDTVLVPGNDEAAMSETDKPTDFYYAELTGNWDSEYNGEGDGFWGESLHYNPIDEIDWNTEVYVGRLPARNTGELSTMVQKIINYEKYPNVGIWMNRAVIATGTQVWPNDKDKDGELEYWLGKKIIDESIKDSMTIAHLTYSPAPIYSYNLSLMDAHIDAGSSLVFFAGHGSPESMISVTSSGYTYPYGTGYAGTSSNYNMPSLFYADACSTNFFDGVSDSLGEVLIKRANAGAIGYIGGARLTWFYKNDTYGTDDDLTLCEMNRGMARLFYQSMFLHGNYQQGKALYEMKKMYLNSRWLTNNPVFNDYSIHNVEWERKNVLTYTLLGDPETDIYTDVALQFAVTDLENPSEFYEGQDIDLFFRDTTNNFPVPYVKVSIKGEDGAYNTYTSDVAGYVKVRLPRGIQDYDYTFTAHNMVPYQGSFSTKADENAPYFSSSVGLNPLSPTADTHIEVSCNVDDDETSVASSYVILSSDNFATYEIYPMDTESPRTYFDVVLPLLDPNTYSYITFIFDYAGNSNYTIWTSSNIFTIPIPPTTFIIIGVNAVFGIGIIWFISRKKPDMKEYERQFESQRKFESPKSLDMINNFETQEPNNENNIN